MSTIELASQYRDSSNLSARQRIYKFGTGGKGFGQWVYEQLDLPATARVLELGCGHAAMWKNLGQRVPADWEMVLTDLSPGMLEEARRNVNGTPGRFHVVRCDAQLIPFAAGSFDGVIANHMLYHVPDREALYRDVVRVLKGGGKFFAATNSVIHLAEMKELIEQFVPGGASVGSIDWFNLENGSQQLSRHFANVSSSHAAGELRVTEAQAVVDYVLSVERAKPAVVGEALERLRRIVEQEIGEKGAYVIHTHGGMFRAVKDASA